MQLELIDFDVQDEAHQRSVKAHWRIGDMNVVTSMSGPFDTPEMTYVEAMRPEAEKMADYLHNHAPKPIGGP